MNRILVYLFSQTSFGRFVDGKKTVIGALLIIVAAGLQALEQIAPMFPQYTWIADTSKGLREAIKAAHLQAAIIGHGGKDGMGNAEYGRIGQRLRREYAFLQGFALDLLEQRTSAPMALARISLYAQSVRGSFWEGASIRKEKQGFSLMRRILDPIAQHCSDCLSFAARGMVPIGSVPLPGQRCACGARCRCSVEYFRQQIPTIMV